MLKWVHGHNMFWVFCVCTTPPLYMTPPLRGSGPTEGSYMGGSYKGGIMVLLCNFAMPFKKTPKNLVGFCKISWSFENSHKNVMGEKGGVSMGKNSHFAYKKQLKLFCRICLQCRIASKKIAFYPVISKRVKTPRTTRKNTLNIFHFDSPKLSFPQNTNFYIEGNIRYPPKALRVSIERADFPLSMDA